MVEKSHNDAELVVIGAHNGSKLENLIRSTVGKVVLVEPVRNLFLKLQERFRDLNSVVYCNYGVSSTTGIKDFYRFDSERIVNGELLIEKLKRECPALDISTADQIGSLNKDHIKKQFEIFNFNPVEFYINEETQFFSFNDFIEKLGISNIKHLQIDTEGHDYNIIKSIPFDKIQIDELVFEWIHMDGPYYADKKCEELLGFLSEKNYKLEFLGHENIRAWKTDLF